MIYFKVYKDKSIFWMKEHQKPGMLKKKVIDNGKINKELNEAKAHKNNKNPQSFLEINPVQKKFFFHIN